MIAVKGTIGFERRVLAGSRYGTLLDCVASITLRALAIMSDSVRLGAIASAARSRSTREGMSSVVEVTLVSGSHPGSIKTMELPTVGGWGGVADAPGSRIRFARRLGYVQVRT